MEVPVESRSYPLRWPVIEFFLFLYSNLFLFMPEITADEKLVAVYGTRVVNPIVYGDKMYVTGI